LGFLLLFLIYNGHFSTIYNNSKGKIHQKLHLISEHSVAVVAILLAVFFSSFFCAGVLKFGSDDIRSRK